MRGIIFREVISEKNNNSFASQRNGTNPEKEEKKKASR